MLLPFTRPRPKLLIADVRSPGTKGASFLFMAATGVSVNATPTAATLIRRGGRRLVSLHEYAIIGLNRTHVGRYLGAMGGFIAATFTMVGASIFQLADKLGWAQWLPGTVLCPSRLFPLMLSVIGHSTLGFGSCGLFADG